MEGAYVGSRGWDLTTDCEIDPGIPAPVPLDQPVRDDATNNFLTQQVTNPFRGCCRNTGSTARTRAVAAAPAVSPVRQHRTFDVRRNEPLRLGAVPDEKRFTRWLQVLAAYTWSEFTERVFRLNPTDTEYEERFGRPLPHRFVVSGIWELPFGRDRRWGSGVNAVVDGLIGGWSVQAIGSCRADGR